LENNSIVIATVLFFKEDKVKKKEFAVIISIFNGVTELFCKVSLKKIEFVTSLLILIVKLQFGIVN